MEFDENTLQGLVKMNNNFLPKKLSESVRLDKLVHFPDRKVGYFYTFFNYSIHDYKLGIFKAAQQRMFHNDLMPDFKKNCANILVQTMLKSGVKLIFIVRSKEGVEMTRLPFTAATCGWKS